MSMPWPFPYRYSRTLALITAIVLFSMSVGCSLLTKPCAVPCGPGEVCVAGACVPITTPPTTIAAPSPAPSSNPSPTPTPTPTPSPTPTTPPTVVCQDPPIWGGPATPDRTIGSRLPQVLASINMVSESAKVSDSPLAGPLVVNGFIAGFKPDDPTDFIGDKNAKRFLRLVGEDIRAQGVCSWWLDTDGAQLDELLVLKAGQSIAERWRIINFNTGRVIADQNAYKKDEIVLAPGPQPTPTPTPSASPSPTPNPEPTPVANDPCPNLPDLGRFGLGVLNRGPNWIKLDATPLVGPDRDRCCHLVNGACEWWSDGRRFCTPLPDFRGYETDGTCKFSRCFSDAEIGTCNSRAVQGNPVWTVGTSEEWHVEDNPYQVRVRAAAAPFVARVCGNGLVGHVCQSLPVNILVQ